MVTNPYVFALSIASKTGKDSYVPMIKSHGMAAIDHTSLAMIEALYNGSKSFFALSQYRLPQVSRIQADFDCQRSHFNDWHHRAGQELLEVLFGAEADSQVDCKRAHRVHV